MPDDDAKKNGVMDTVSENKGMPEDGLLLADAGGSKTDWIFVCDGKASKFTAAGMNLAVMGKEAVLAAVLSAAESMGDMAARVRDIRYYGAGVIGSGHVIELDAVLKNVFPGASVSYGSDLLLAAEAGLGNGSGIICILGTGSNSGMYDGRKIVSNIRPGGYILGDEGGGSALGRMLLSDYVKGRLPESIMEKFSAAYPGLSYSVVVEHVYRGGNPAGYLASFAPFVLSCRGDGYADGLIDRNLRNFVERSVLPYGRADCDIAVSGSMGVECRKELESLGRGYGLHFIRFVKSPADVLAQRILEAVPCPEERQTVKSGGDGPEEY